MNIIQKTHEYRKFNYKQVQLIDLYVDSIRYDVDATVVKL